MTGKILTCGSGQTGAQEGRTKMTDKVIENNQVIIMGKIVSDFEFSHEIFGEGFYMVDVEVARLQRFL